MAYIYTIRRKLLFKVIVFVVCVCTFMPFGTNIYNIRNKSHPGYSELADRNIGARIHFATVDNFYNKRVTWPTSVLGGILFKHDDLPLRDTYENNTYVVLVWKYWNWLKRRHVENYGKKDERHILDGCSVKNCIFSGDNNLLDTADAVLIHLQKGEIPKVIKRNPKQRWIFLNDESPKNAFSLKKGGRDLTLYYNVFNWSMTYRSDSDVPVPYGRTVPRDDPVMTDLELPEVAALVPNWKNKIRHVPATVLMSNCGVKERNDFLNELRKYMQVDVYGGCADKEEFKKSCPGHFRNDCKPIEKYLFYLVLENTSCYQYITEKIFYHAYFKGAIPVIWGPYIEDVETLLPPFSYIYADKNTNVETLAQTMLKLAENDALLLSMHMWRNNFDVVNEHGYFGTKSHHLCRLCEALNYNEDKEEIYDEEKIHEFLDPAKSCNGAK